MCALSTNHSRSPNILPNPLYPVPELVDTGIPLLQPRPHIIDLLHIKHLGLHPANPRHLGHLIDTALQQPQTQRLHDQDLDLLRRDLGLARDRLERHSAVVRRAAEDGLRQGRQRDLLSQEHLVFFEELLLRQVALQPVVGG